MNTQTLTSICLARTFASATPSSAEERTLSQAEAQELFSDKTFDGHQVVKNKDFRVFSSSDGQHTVHFANGKVKTGTWEVDDEGRHCVTLRKKRCTKVVAVGDGVYHKKKANGKHTHTLSNFQAGNQL